MTNSPMFVLLHSPLVGPLTWQPVARCLDARGCPVQVPSLVDVISGEGPYYGTVAERIGSSLTGPAVLVAHSGAGALLPVIAAAAPEPPRAVVFVDALLPHPGRTWFETVSAALADQVRDLAQGDQLPPWDQWFAPESITALLPDPVLREQFRAELPRVPLAYLTEPAPAVAPLPAGRCAYLRLSEAYRAEAAEAQAMGWPVAEESADHLAMLTRPEAVADALQRVLDQVGCPVS
ncbi:MAG TPA: alpha/beta fold hydrolase [Pseudonocardiaceae bacterium]|nr:alpha/beta fold hydrolase [Pseudonocardiaceae bacterium]